MTRRGLALAAALGAFACGRGDTFDAGGVVREVRAEERQVTIEHGDIPGLMPAMTMSFDVADPALLAGLAPGQYVEFRIARRGERFEIVSLGAPEGAGEAGASEASRGDSLAAAGDPAPDFALIDQDAHPISLVSLRGKAVLLDFVYTSCPGPCPILTGLHQKVRDGLSEADRARVQLVSITLDPERDTPAALRAWAGARRLDTRGWTFATGPSADVDAVVRAYGVGRVRSPSGEIEHTIATFLIDREGRIVRRYLGLDHEPDAMRADLERVLPAEARPGRS
ncbi:MAG TPA: SCO family protein [Myxococcota bacterium]|nr:SCO family protein [Myxococcota bacterium]